MPNEGTPKVKRPRAPLDRILIRSGLTVYKQRCSVSETQINHPIMKIFDSKYSDIGNHF